MKRLFDCTLPLVGEVEGATMVEYGLMIALITATCFAAVTLVGTSIGTLFGGASAKIGAAGAGTSEHAPHR